MRADKAEAHASAAHTGEGRRNLPGSGVGAEARSVAAGRTKPEAPRLMEAVVERSNMLCAYERVVKNEGAPGVDGLGLYLAGVLANRHDRVGPSLSFNEPFLLNFPPAVPAGTREYTTARNES
jgi:hypothetical protein